MVLNSLDKVVNFHCINTRYFEVACESRLGHHPTFGSHQSQSQNVSNYWFQVLKTKSQLQNFTFDSKKSRFTGSSHRKLRVNFKTLESSLKRADSLIPGFENFKSVESISQSKNDSCKKREEFSVPQGHGEPEGDTNPSQMWGASKKEWTVTLHWCFIWLTHSVKDYLINISNVVLQLVACYFNKPS